jgi:hypothetical protein
MTLDDAQSMNKETVAGMIQVCDAASITCREDYILDSNNHSMDKTSAKECAATETNLKIQPHSSTQFRIPVKTSQQGFVVLHGSLNPSMKRGIDVAHLKQYWSYYAHILPGNNLSIFHALTEDNINEFLDRLNQIHQEMLNIEKAVFEEEIVSAFNHSD